MKSDDGNTRLEIYPSEAQIVERIYRLRGEHGNSLKRIAHTLNSEGVSLRNRRKLISHPESVHQARALMAEQFGKLTLTPVNENGIASYAARGKVDFFGEEAMIRVSGAGGQNRTTRVYPFSLSLGA